MTGFWWPLGSIVPLSTGTYLGPYEAPVVLYYPSLGIGPVGGGLWIARLSLIAAQDGMVNLPPSFTKGPDLTVWQNSGPFSMNAWATDISPGSASETNQILSFMLTNNHPALFSVAPKIAPNGTLSFTPALAASGTACITLVLQDNGGTAYGGENISAPALFTITIRSPLQAVEALAQSVQDADFVHLNKRPLLASLRAASSCLERDAWRLAANHLGQFQAQVSKQVAPDYPRQAEAWISEAQEIIDWLSASTRSRRAPVTPAAQFGTTAQ